MERGAFEKTDRACLRVSRVAALCLVVASTRGGVQSSSPHPGDLDPSFGNSGTLKIGFNPDHAVGTGVAIGPDNKIIVAGSEWPGAAAPGEPAIARLNVDGKLDSSFGSGGVVTRHFNGDASVDLCGGVAIQRDGRVVIAGSTGVATSNFALLRFNNDGSPDSTFGAGGSVVTDIRGFDDGAVALAIQDDGKIVAVGFASNGFGADQQDFAVVRYNTDGTLDSSFGSGWKVTTDFRNFTDRASAVAIQPDGRIVVAGSCEFTPPLTTIVIRFFALARYNPDGSLDTSFGNGGKVTTAFRGIFDEAYGVVIQGDGKIVAAGIAGNPNGSDFGLIRYNVDGSLDSSFGDGGKVQTNFFDGDDSASAVVIQQNGKIVAAGTAASSPEGQRDFALARYNEDGSLDAGFGQGGKFTTDFFNANDEIAAAALQRDGKIVVCGLANVGVSPKFVVARYEGDPPIPSIISASISGKNLVVVGSNFDSGAVILIDGIEQKTRRDEQDPNTLVGKKSAKRIGSGQRVALQVRDGDGAVSAVFPFVRP